MKSDLAGVINRNLVLVIHVVKGRLAVVSRLFARLFVERAHGDLMSVDVDVLLQKRHRLGQNIETGSNQINKEHFVILDDAEHALVVVASAFGSEVNNDAR